MNDSIFSFYWNDSADYLTCSPEKLFLEIGGKKQQISFTNLISVKLDTKKKLAPLIIGAVVTSLALVNILLEGAGLTMMGFLSIGVLTLYFGLSDYWVITIEKYDNSQATWISKNKCPQFPLTLVNIVNFKVSKGFFPPFYAVLKKDLMNESIANAGIIEKVKEPIEYYLLPPKLTEDQVLAKIDISQISKPIEFVQNQRYLAKGEYKINITAIINTEA